MGPLPHKQTKILFAYFKSVFAFDHVHDSKIFVSLVQGEAETREHGFVDSKVITMLQVKRTCFCQDNGNSFQTKPYWRVTATPCTYTPLPQRED